MASYKCLFFQGGGGGNLHVISLMDRSHLNPLTAHITAILRINIAAYTIHYDPSMLYPYASVSQPGVLRPLGGDREHIPNEPRNHLILKAVILCFYIQEVRDDYC